MGDQQLKLFLPDWSELDLIRRSSQPFALWPVGDSLILEHWMGWAAGKGCKQLDLYVLDRPAEIRAALEGGAYWSIDVKVHALSSQSDLPEDARHVTSLPEWPDEHPASPEALLDLWLRLNHRWIKGYAPEGPQIVSQHLSGAWLGPGASIHPDATILPPVWIGGRSKVGEACQIGPYVVIGEGCLLDRDVIVKDSVILEDSYVGAHLGVNEMIIEGGKLLDVAKGIRVDIGESFILESVVQQNSPPSWLSRGVALLVWLLAAVPALVFCASILQQEKAQLTCSGGVNLREGTRGPLIFRRWSWLPQIMAGRFHWFGVLPRSLNQVPDIAEETADRIRSAPIGVFSLADIYGVHSSNEEDEWVHAAYQALADSAELKKLFLKNVWRLWCTVPK